MRRIHPEPDNLSMKNLSKLVRALGFSMPRTPDRTAIQGLLAAVRGSDSSLAVNLVVLRSFEKAQYAPLHIGHFALASGHYCHFTSPIRRYADLLVHRILEYYLRKRLDSVEQELDLTEIGKHITFTEQRAEDAERELRAVLILQMLSKKIGEKLDCVVTGLTNFGVFVQSRKFGIEGLIVMGDLGPEKWRFDSKTQSIVGQGSGQSIHLGQAIKVRIVSVNVPARQLNVAPVEALAKASMLRAKGKSAKKRQKGQTRKRSKKRSRKTHI
jgi:ribonuclease R